VGNWVPLSRSPLRNLSLCLHRAATVRDAVALHPLLGSSGSNCHHPINDVCVTSACGSPQARGCSAAYASAVDNAFDGPAALVEHPTGVSTHWSGTAHQTAAASGVALLDRGGNGMPRPTLAHWVCVNR
jgi:hypothetical protein